MQIVTIFIQNSQNQLLIQKRSKLKSGKYGITSGHTLQNETAKKGAQTQVRKKS